MWETWVQSLGWEDPLEKEMTTHSSTFAWKIPWTEEPGRLQSMGSQRVRPDWTTSLSLFTFTLSGLLPAGTPPGSPPGIPAWNDPYWPWQGSQRNEPPSNILRELPWQNLYPTLASRKDFTHTSPTWRAVFLPLQTSLLSWMTWRKREGKECLWRSWPKNRGTVIYWNLIIGLQNSFLPSHFIIILTGLLWVAAMRTMKHRL